MQANQMTRLAGALAVLSMGLWVTGCGVYARNTGGSGNSSGVASDISGGDTADEDRSTRTYAAFSASSSDVAGLDEESRGPNPNVMDQKLQDAIATLLDPAAQELVHRAAVDQLMEIARNEEDSELTKNAIFWLGQSDDPRVAEFLLEIIRRGGAR